MSTDTNLNDLLKNPEQIKQMIGLLSALLDATNNQQSTEVDDQQSSPNTKPEKIHKKTKPQRENKFLAMPEANMHKEDPSLAAKLYKQPPMARTRRNQTVKARCRVCGREEVIQSSLIYGGVERFKCNKCSATPG